MLADFTTGRDFHPAPKIYFYWRWLPPPPSLPRKPFEKGLSENFFDLIIL